MKPSYVTFSVDDGHPTDLTTAELLQKYELKATFYIPLRNAERCVMSGSQIQQLGRQFEIGAHTVNHVALTSLNKEQAWSEVKDGKIWLENLLGNEVVSFCYPRGKFSATTAALVRKAGFLGARACLFNLVEFPGDPFCWGVSTHAYNHSPYIQVRHALLEENFRGVWNYFAMYGATTDWRKHFICALDHVEQHGGIAHLYLHSWEIDSLGQWNELESMFKLVSDRKSLARVTNGDLFRMWNLRNNGHHKT